MKIRLILALAAFSIGFVFSVNVFAVDTNRSVSGKIKTPQPVTTQKPKASISAAKPQTPAAVTTTAPVQGDQFKVIEDIEKRTATLKKTYTDAASYCSNTSPDSMVSCTSESGKYDFRACKGTATCGISKSIYDLDENPKYKPKDCSSFIEEDDKEKFDECTSSNKERIKAKEGARKKLVNEPVKESCKNMAKTFKDAFTTATSEKKSSNSELDKILKEESDKVKEREDSKLEFAKKIEETTQTADSNLEKLRSEMAEADARIQEQLTNMSANFQKQKNLIQDIKNESAQVVNEYQSAIDGIENACITQALNESKKNEAHLKAKIQAGANKMQSASDVLSSSQRGGVRGSTSNEYKILTAECFNARSTRNAREAAYRAQQIRLSQLTTKLNQAIAEAVRQEKLLQTAQTDAHTRKQLNQSKANMLQQQAVQTKQRLSAKNVAKDALFAQQLAEIQKRRAAKEDELAEATSDVLTYGPLSKNYPLESESDKTDLSALNEAIAFQKSPPELDERCKIAAFTDVCAKQTAAINQLSKTCISASSSSSSDTGASTNTK